MTDLMPWYVFTLILCRVSSFFVILPLTSYRGIPNLLKIFFGLAAALFFFLSGAYSLKTVPESSLVFGFYLAGEAFLGLCLGFLVLLYFSLFRMAGQLMDIKIGLMTASIFDSQFGSTVTLLGQFYYLFALVLYLAFDGHHTLFMALGDSFKLVPLGGVFFTDGSLHFFWQLFYGLFALAFQIAAPITAVIIITDVSLGLISKTVPQLHVFIVGLPLKIAMGLLVLFLVLPYWLPIMEDVFGRIYIDIMTFLESMA